MKKFLAIWALLLMLGSCSQYEEVDLLPTPEGVEHSITATTGDQTRAFFERDDVANAYKHYWEAGDDLSVFPQTTTNTEYELSEVGEPANQATFTGKAVVGGSGDYYAIYPYHAENALSGEVLTVNYPAEQTFRTDKSSYDRSSYLMVSKSASTDLQFKNITSALRLTLTGEATITKIVLESIGHETLAGEAAVQFDTAGEPQITLKGKGSSITLNCLQELSATPTHFYLALPPVEMKTGFKVTVYDNAGWAMTKTHTFEKVVARNTVLEMPAFAYEAKFEVAPQADLLDIVFMEDGTAKDISTLQLMQVESRLGSGLETYYDYTLGQYVARFTHPISNGTYYDYFQEGYYRAIYSHSEEAKTRLKDSHTLECFCSVGTEFTVASNGTWSAPFSNLEGGGTGLYYFGTNFMFRPHVNGSYLNAVGSSEATDLAPVVGQTYHLVGVWDGTKATLYVNGVPGTAVEKTGVMTLVADQVQWFGIGCDSQNNSSGNAQNMWNGDIYTARIYDQALNETQVKALYNKTLGINGESNKQMISEINYLKEETVSAGYNYVVYGEGFESGDVLKLNNGKKSYSCTTATYDTGATFTVPADFESGNYNLVVERGSQAQILGKINLTMSAIPQADMLDMVFGPNAAAYDGSSMMMPVIPEIDNNGSTLVTYSSWDGSYIARIDCGTPGRVWSTDNRANYRIPYGTAESNGSNPIFKSEYTATFSFESLFMMSEIPAWDEAKTSRTAAYVMGNHQGGGVGLLLTQYSKTEKRNGTSNSTTPGYITFAPNTGTYYFTQCEPSNVGTAEQYIGEPTLGEYYHVVGTWDQSTGDVILYINGKETARTSGKATSNLQFPAVGCQSICIGADTEDDAPGETGRPMEGDIALARIYDRALTAADVEALYNDAKQNHWPQQLTLSVLNVEYKAEESVSEGYNFSIYGDGFKSGDVLCLEGSQEYTCTTKVSTNGAALVIPEGFQSGKYSIVLKRGDEEQSLGDVTLNLSTLPEADLFDAVFYADKSAVDASAMMMPIARPDALFNQSLTYPNTSGDGTYIAQFSNIPGYESSEDTSISPCTGCYNTHYAENYLFKDLLGAAHQIEGGGHTMEVIMMANELDPAGLSNASKIDTYMFGTHHAGGTALLCNKTDYCFCFQPNLNGSYKYAKATTAPTIGKYYHVVGTWDWATGSVKLYIDGQEAASVSATAKTLLKHNNGRQFLVVGGDSKWISNGTDYFQGLWNGDISRARIYGKALSADEVAALYSDAKQNHWPTDWNTATPKKSADNTADEVKVMSFNIRYLGGEGESNTNYWGNRREGAVALIADHRPTVFGVQEAQSAQWTYLVEEMAKIGYLPFGATDTVFGTGCFYDSNQVELVDYNGERPYFWISRSPDSEEVSKSWNTAQERSVMWGIFKVKATGQHFCYMNTHLDHVSQLARAEGLKLILERFKHYNPEGYPQIFNGDLNCPFGNEAFEPVKEVMKNARYAAPTASSDVHLTHNNWGYESLTYNKILDHIFCDRDLEVVEYHTITDSYRADGGLYVSDHYPIYAIIKLQ